jgi:glycosyltransferase involved in cell wall biosynthesis
MKILQVVDIGYIAGGAEQSVKLIRDTLQERGHQVFVLSTDKNSAGEAVFADELIPAIRGSSISRLLRYYWNPPAYRTGRRIIRDFKPDIVHLHTISEFSPALLWGLGKTPMVLTVHGPEEFTLKLLPWLLPANNYRNDSYQWSDIRLAGRLRYWYYRYLQRPAYRLALSRVKLIIAPSKYMMQATKQDFPRTPMTQVYNGIVLPRQASLPRSSHPTVLYVGRLEAVKGVDHLIEAFSVVRQTLPNCQLRVIGDGGQLTALKRRTQQLGLTADVEFPGWVKPQRIAQEYAAATVVAIPSIWPENLPTVAIEALAIGRPIVGSNTGGVAELVEDGVNGFVVEPGDEPGLAKALDAILSDSRLLKGMAKASAIKSGAFNKERFVDQLIDVYKGVLHEDRHS